VPSRQILVSACCGKFLDIVPERRKPDAARQHLAAAIIGSARVLPNCRPSADCGRCFPLRDGGERVTGLGEIVMILDLHRQGAGVSAIARRTGLDRKTVRKVIAGGLEPAIYGPRQRRTTQLQPFEPNRDIAWKAQERLCRR
jgi:hypothetical protein